MDWLHNGKPIYSHDDFTDDVIGFCYKITYSNSKCYIGKKLIRSERVEPARRNGVLRDNCERVFKHIMRFDDGSIAVSKQDKNKARRMGIKAKREGYDKGWKDLPFAKYEGSTENSKDLVIESKEILELATDKTNLSYIETKWLMREDVLCSEIYINDNISATYFRGKIIKGK